MFISNVPKTPKRYFMIHGLCHAMYFEKVCCFHLPTHLHFESLTLDF